MSRAAAVRGRFAAACLLLAASLGAGEALALGTSGAALPSAAITATGVAAGGTSLPWAEVAIVSRATPPATAISGGVVTIQGEILRGQPSELDQGILRCSSYLTGPRQYPLGALAGIILGPLDLGALPALLAGPPGSVLGNGERVAGTLSFLNAEAVGLDTGRRVAQVPRGRVAMIVLRPVQVAATPCTWFQLGSGDRVLAGGAVAVPPEAVVAAWRDGPGCLHLTHTTPRRAGATDRQGAALPVRPGAGFPGLVGGLATPTGVRLPARGEVAWDAAGHGRLLAWAACPSGSMATIASVVLDGKVAWEQILQPGAAAVAVSVPLAGATEVGLRSGPGADGETGMRQVLWGMPVLMR